MDFIIWMTGGNWQASWTACLPAADSQANTCPSTSCALVEEVMNKKGQLTLIASDLDASASTCYCCLLAATGLNPDATPPQRSTPVLNDAELHLITSVVSQVLAKSNLGMHMPLTQVNSTLGCLFPVQCAQTRGFIIPRPAV